jgi:hypothetical protein
MDDVSVEDGIVHIDLNGKTLLIQKPQMLMKYCQALDLYTNVGNDQWRLPNKDELEYIYKHREKLGLNTQPGMSYDEINNIIKVDAHPGEKSIVWSADYTKFKDRQRVEEYSKSGNSYETTIEKIRYTVTVLNIVEGEIREINDVVCGIYGDMGLVILVKNK